MKIVLKTPVNGSPESVYAQFDQSLFLKLAPPGIPVKLKRFDGSKKGDIVHLELSLFGIKQQWISHITEHGVHPDFCFFVDESAGKDLPFFLRKWKHQHKIQRIDGQTYIIDEIDFTAMWGLSWLFYPGLWLQFAWRKPIYKRIFSK